MKFITFIIFLSAAAVFVFACFCVYWAYSKPNEALTYWLCAVVNFINSVSLALSARTLRAT